MRHVGKHILDGPPVPTSPRCPYHSYVARLQYAEVKLYTCTCEWDYVTARQLDARRTA